MKNTYAVKLVRGPTVEWLDQNGKVTDEFEQAGRFTETYAGALLEKWRTKATWDESRHTITAIHVEDF